MYSYVDLPFFHVTCSFLCMFTSNIFHLFVKLNLQIRMQPHTMLQLLKYSGFRFLAQTTHFSWKRSSLSDLLFMVYWVLLSLGKSEQCTTLSNHLRVVLWKTSITVQIPMYLQVTLLLFHFKCPTLSVFIPTVLHLFMKQNAHSFECIHLPCMKFWNNPAILCSLVYPPA